MEFKKLSSDFKSEAKFALKGEYSKALLASLIATAMGVQTTASNFSLNLNFKAEESTNPFPSVIPHEIIVLLIIIGCVALLSSIGFFIIGSIISTGYAKYNLDLVNNNCPSIGLLFKYFKYAKRIIIANLLILLKVFLWSLLFIIPGIIAAYSYAMVPYILAENPNLEPKEVLDLSKKMMKGNKWRFFCLGFSFIGWYILCILTLGIGYVFLAPYPVAANACFYKDVSIEYWDPLMRVKPGTDREDNIFDEKDILFNQQNNKKVYYSSDDLRL